MRPTFSCGKIQATNGCRAMTDLDQAIRMLEPEPDYRHMYDRSPALALMAWRPYTPRDHVPVMRRPDKPCSLGCGNMMRASTAGNICAACYSARYREARANGCKQAGRPRLIVQVGERFGRLTVIGDAGLDRQKGRLVALQCDCGVIVTRRLTSMRLASGQKRESSCSRRCAP